MFDKLGRVLRFLGALSFDTHLWCVSVIGGAILLTASFFVNPVDRIFILNGRIVNAEENSIEVVHNQMNYGSVLGSPEGSSVSQDELEDINALSDNAPISLMDGTAVSAEDFDALCRIIECEAESEDMKGKVLVADVILNRIGCDIFPDSIAEVIESPGQFDPVTSKAYFVAYPSNDSKEAAMRALNGEDYSEGALYFQKSTCEVWGDKTYLFRYGSHSFYK